jgi:hypothetical protein
VTAVAAMRMYPVDVLHFVSDCTPEVLKLHSL